MDNIQESVEEGACISKGNEDFLLSDRPINTAENWVINPKSMQKLRNLNWNLSRADISGQIMGRKKDICESEVYIQRCRDTVFDSAKNQEFVELETDMENSEHVY